MSPIAIGIIIALALVLGWVWGYIEGREEP